MVAANRIANGAAAFGCVAAPAKVLDSMPFAPDTNRVLESAVQEAMRLGHNYIGTEHLLLGVLAVPGLEATDVLVGMGVTELVESRVLSALEFFLAGRGRDEHGQ